MLCCCRLCLLPYIQLQISPYWRLKLLQKTMWNKREMLKEIKTHSWEISRSPFYISPSPLLFSLSVWNNNAWPLIIRKRHRPRIWLVLSNTDKKLVLFLFNWLWDFLYILSLAGYSVIVALLSHFPSFSCIISIPFYQLLHVVDGGAECFRGNDSILRRQMHEYRYARHAIK